MKISIWFILLLVACVPEQKTSSYSMNLSAPSRWNPNVFPLVIKIAPTFDQSDISAIVDAGDSWSDSIQNDLQFFDFTQPLTTTNSFENLASYLDNEMGVYISDDWYDELPSNALAITQLYGYRKQIGSPNEYVEVFHADIILNNDSYEFSSSFIPGTYDLETVVLHEMGHFLGLYHVSDPFIDSVMYPSVTRSTVYRSPYAFDGESLEALYDLGGTSSALLAGGNQNSAIPQYEGPVEPVKILMELYPNGECLHRMNGQIIHRH